MEINNKEVYFNDYCSKCEYEEVVDGEPCNECLSIPVREYSHKPEFFKEKETS